MKHIGEINDGIVNRGQLPWIILMGRNPSNSNLQVRFNYYTITWGPNTRLSYKDAQSFFMANSSIKLESCNPAENVKIQRKVPLWFWRTLPMAAGPGVPLVDTSTFHLNQFFTGFFQRIIGRENGLGLAQFLIT